MSSPFGWGTIAPSRVACSCGVGRSLVGASSVGGEMAMAWRGAGGGTRLAGWAAIWIAVGSLSLVVGHARADSNKPSTKAQRDAASQAFHSCHEQEGLGDATTCWRLWLER